MNLYTSSNRPMTGAELGVGGRQLFARAAANRMGPGALGGLGATSYTIGKEGVEALNKGGEATWTEKLLATNVTGQKDTVVIEKLGWPTGGGMPKWAVWGLIIGVGVLFGLAVLKRE